jgi:DNA polymerase-3 subunit beta
MITTSVGALRSALTATTLIDHVRPPLPVLGGLLIQTKDGTTTLTAYDFDACITVALPGTTSGPDERFVVGHFGLAKLTKSRRGSAKALADVPATITDHGDHATLTLGDMTAELMTLPVDDWPAMPAQVPPDWGVDRADFARAVRAAACAVERDDALPVLTGIDLRASGRDLILQSTDRYRAVSTRTHIYADLSQGHAPTAIVPGRLLAKLLSKTSYPHALIGVSADPRGEGWVTVHSGALAATLRLIPGVFPKLAPLVPREPETTVTVGRRAFAALLIDAATVRDATGQRGALVYVRPDVDSIAVAASETAAATPISADGHGVLSPILFNARYLSDALNTMPGDSVTLHVAPGRRVAAFVPEGAPLSIAAEHLHLIVPVQPSA